MTGMNGAGRTALALLLITLPGASAAQQPPADEGPIELKLAPDPALEAGTVAVVQGTVDTAGLWFRLGGLSLTQPAAVILLSEDPADDLRLTLVKYDRTMPERAGSTRGDGFVTLKFRTQGFVEIGVESAGEPRPFALVAWAGDEIPAAPPSVLVAPGEYRGGAEGSDEYGNGDSRGGLDTLLLAIVFLAGATAAVVARRRRRGNA